MCLFSLVRGETMRRKKFPISYMLEKKFFFLKNVIHRCNLTTAYLSTGFDILEVEIGEGRRTPSGGGHWVVTA
jgi:hypothetical protein